MKEWRNIAGLLSPETEDAPVAFVGAPVRLGSVTPGACDQAPAATRAAMRRIGTYDLESGRDLAVAIYDAGDLDVVDCSPADCFARVRDGAGQLARRRELTIIVGGNNAITRPGVLALGDDLSRIGLITFDAHFDMRDTSDGLTNGNPVQALLDDGMPGGNIAQIGLAPFANAKYMHDAAKEAGNRLYTMADIAGRGIAAIVAEALDAISGKCDAISADFDIDVIERGLAPGAPGARPGGMTTADFFAAARISGAHPKVRAVDLAEFDPSLDVSDITALVAGRWVAEILSGFETRKS